MLVHLSAEKMVNMMVERAVASVVVLVEMLAGWMAIVSGKTMVAQWEQ